ncbi:hypothetical protein [Weissella cibaria]|uniref:hypothetical protein n=1 Tax=Weissella cibaria TaxID=137591 RepID=UPI0007062FA8|nr:hypothetical protein [Weissella cibaria]ALI33920.1 hypothetical protein AO080_10920 [Weissella cibaria]
MINVWHKRTKSRPNLASAGSKLSNGKKLTAELGQSRMTVRKLLDGQTPLIIHNATLNAVDDWLEHNSKQ